MDFFSGAASGSDLLRGGAKSSTVLGAPTNQYSVQQPMSQYLLGNTGDQPAYTLGAYDNRSGAYSGSASGGGAASTYDPADLAYLQDQRSRLQNQLSSSNTALNNGLTQLGDSYNKEVSGANTKRSQTLEDFAVKKEDTTRGKDQALGKVDTNARTLAESVRRRLGMASGSNSSAYQLAAPNAVARDATKNRTGVLENYGQNFRDLGTAEDRAKSEYDSLLQDLEAQRKTRESDFRASILGQQNNISNSLAEVARQEALLRGGGYNQVKSAMAPYVGEIDSRQAQIDNLFNQFRTPFSVKAVDVKAPTLRDYTVDRAAISANGTQGESQYSPYLQFLKKQDEQSL